MKPKWERHRLLATYMERTGVLNNPNRQGGHASSFFIRITMKMHKRLSEMTNADKAEFLERTNALKRQC